MNGLKAVDLRVGDHVENLKNSSWSAHDPTDRIDPGDIGVVVEVFAPMRGPVMRDDDGEVIDTSRDGYARVKWPKCVRHTLVRPEYEGKSWRKV
jgi:hypothetical protein